MEYIRHTYFLVVKYITTVHKLVRTVYEYYASKLKSFYYKHGIHMLLKRWQIYNWLTEYTLFYVYFSSVEKYVRTYGLTWCIKYTWITRENILKIYEAFQLKSTQP